ncbi:MAG: S1 RNA-binding domain-containing protein, partial [Actinomycetota bacterium]
SWKHVDHPSEVVEVGEEVEVEILDVDLERERVSLSLKATQEDPWRQFARAHNVGDIIEGRVTKLVPFGAFVEVDDAIEGLVHISELAEHHVEKAEDEVGVHERVSVKIIDIDLDRRRISLSRKQALRTEGMMPEGVAEVGAGAEEPKPDMELEQEAEMELDEELAPVSEVEPEPAAEAEVEPEPAAESAPAEAEETPLEEVPPEQAVEEPTEEAVSSADAAPEATEPEDETDAESIESIVEDLKRERGSS